MGLRNTTALANGLIGLEQTPTQFFPVGIGATQLQSPDEPAIVASINSLIAASGGALAILFAPTRAAMIALVAPNVPFAVYVQEVAATYVFVPGGAGTNAWTNITGTGGAAGKYLFVGNEMTLPIRGGGLDDWPNYAAAVAALAAIGATLILQAGTYICATVQTTPSYARVRGMGRGRTFVKQTLTSGTGVATVAAISATYVLTGAPSTLSTTSPYGANVFFSNANFVNSYVMLQQAGQSFRWATYKVIRATGAGPYNQFVDAPNLLGYTAGDAIQAVTPVLRVYISGITFQGTGSRYIEILGAVECHCWDIEFDSVTFGSVSERFISIDVASRNCSLRKFSGNGNNVVTLGTSMESCFQVVYEDGEITQCTSAAHVFQDATDCHLVRYSGAACNVGALVSHALVNTLGSSGCGIHESTLTYNTVGVDFDVTTRDCSIDSRSNVSDNSTRNISIDAASVGVQVHNTRATDSPIAIFADVNCKGVKITNVDTSNSARGLDLACEMDVSGWYHNGITGASPEIILVRAGGILRARGLDLQTNSVSFAVQCAAGGIARIAQSVIRLSNAGSAGLIVNGAGAMATVRDSKIVQSVAGCFGLYAQVGTIRYEGVDADGCTTPIFSGAGTGLFDHFQVVANNAVAVVIAWPDLKTGEKAFFTRTVNGGAPGIGPVVTYIPGTSITATFIAGDTSTYDAEVR